MESSLIFQTFSQIFKSHFQSEHLDYNVVYERQIYRYHTIFSYKNEISVSGADPSMKFSTKPFYTNKLMNYLIKLELNYDFKILYFF